MAENSKTPLFPFADQDSPEKESEKLTTNLPSALSGLDEWKGWFVAKKPVVFLDYDGVLTPIVRRPEDAKISGNMRKAVLRLQGLCTVAIVSGRDLQDVKKLAALPGIVYAGSHGFDIEVPDGENLEFQKGTEYLPSLDRAEVNLKPVLSEIKGVRIERKKFAIAVHFRGASEEKEAEIERAVEEEIRKTKGLRKTGGKKIFELRPDIDWDKGRAVSFLMETLRLKPAEHIPLYIGDDITDEDAFRELRKDGIGIVVRDESRPTLARYALEDPEEVGNFLRRLAALLEDLPR